MPPSGVPLLTPTPLKARDALSPSSLFANKAHDLNCMLRKLIRNSRRLKSSLPTTLLASHSRRERKESAARVIRGRLSAPRARACLGSPKEITIYLRSPRDRGARINALHLRLFALQRGIFAVRSVVKQRGFCAEELRAARANSLERAGARLLGADIFCLI